MTEREYWIQCLTEAAEECDATLTKEQIVFMANQARSAHEHYDLGFSIPSPNERINAVESEWQRKYEALQAEFDRHKNLAEHALKNAYRIHRDDSVSIEPNGAVTVYDGRERQIG